LSGVNFDLPTWMLLLCFLGGLVYATALYYRNKQFAGKNRWLKSVLGFLRFSLISGLLILLLNPFLKSLLSEEKDPVIALVQDNSQSVGKWLGSDQDAYLNRIDELKSKLSEKYTVDFYTLGSNVGNKSDSLGFADELTNLEIIKNLIDQYEGANLSAVILASDGLYNQGKNPIYSGLPKTIPVNAIALGDTAKRKDLLIKNIYHNKIAYLNDMVNIQIDVSAFNCLGNLTKLIIEEEQEAGFKSVFQTDISLNNSEFFKTIEAQIELKKPGISHFRASLSGVRDEDTNANNRKDFFIEVLDARQQIRILANGPHPDLSALKTILTDNKNYEVEIEHMKDNPDPSKRADVVIFHNLPSDQYDIESFLDRMNQNKTPRIFITGTKTNLVTFNKMQNLVTIERSSGGMNEVQALVRSDFSLFTLSDAIKGSLSNFPPLLSPFGDYKLNPTASVLLKQKIGTIETEYPLLIYQNSGGIRSTVMCGEGIWKWKLFDYLERENFDIIKELINKSVVYTSVKEDKRKFRVSTQQRLYNENENIIFNGELYNDSYELINDGDIFLTLTNSAREEFNYTFSKKDNYYLLDIGTLPPGSYNYKATTNHNGNQLTDGGSLRIQEIQYELYNLEADHGLLYSLAEMTNGKVYRSDAMEDLSNDLLSNENMKPVLYQYAQNKSVIDFKWLFYALLGMLGLEWFLRRYNGYL
jgi:hypothetical protein